MKMPHRRFSHFPFQFVAQYLFLHLLVAKATPENLPHGTLPGRASINWTIFVTLEAARVTLQTACTADAQFHQARSKMVAGA
jgi:hypothetical protein